MGKLTNKEMQDLTAKFGIKDEEAKRLFESFMNSKVEEIRNQARAEAYETVKKQFDLDKKALVESAEKLINESITNGQKKMDVQRKALIQEKLKLQEATNSVKKHIADEKMSLKESNNQKLDATIKKMIEAKDAEIKSLRGKVVKFVNECVKTEVLKTRGKQRQMNESINEMQKFVQEQVMQQAREHREEMKSIDKLKHDLVVESQTKYRQEISKALKDMASKVESFVNESVKKEITQFRKDIKNARQNNFGKGIFEAFAKEYGKQFFNSDKMASDMVKIARKKQEGLKKIVESANAKIKSQEAEIKALRAAKDTAIREKIINEAANALPASKRDTLKMMVKGVPTEQLQDKVNSYVSIIMNENSRSNINKGNGKMLNESAKVRVVTGDSKFRKPLTIGDKSDDELNSMINELINI